MVQRRSAESTIGGHVDPGTRSSPARISDEQKRVLRRLLKTPYSTPYQCRCSVTTFEALARRGLIRVVFTLGAVAFPRNSAEAYLTDAGRAVLAPRP